MPAHTVIYIAPMPTQAVKGIGVQSSLPSTEKCEKGFYLQRVPDPTTV